jgi:hypothetical protein
MKPLFLISSALNTKHGVYDTTTRLNQTIDTLKSIRERFSDAIIVISESSGERSIDQEQIDKLTEHADYIINYHSDSQVKTIYQIPNHDIVKSYTEMLCMLKTLDYIMKIDLINTEKIDRAFKLSGRYKLNDNFSIDNFSNDKFVFAKRRPSQFPIQVTNGLTEQFMSRLWSWPGDKTLYVFEKYKFMLEDFVSNLGKNFYVDVEHCLCKHFSENVLELDKIGVEGWLGPNGISVLD